MLVSSSRNRHDFAKSRETREFAYAVTSLSCFDHEGCHRQPLEMTRIHFQSGSKRIAAPARRTTCIGGWVPARASLGRDDVWKNLQPELLLALAKGAQPQRVE